MHYAIEHPTVLLHFDFHCSHRKRTSHRSRSVSSGRASQKYSDDPSRVAITILPRRALALASLVSFLLPIPPPRPSPSSSSSVVVFLASQNQPRRPKIVVLLAREERGGNVCEVAHKKGALNVCVRFLEGKKGAQISLFFFLCNPKHTLSLSLPKGL